LTALRFDTEGNPTQWLEAEAATVALVSTLNAGAGVFLGRQKQWMVGGRIHYISVIEFFSSDERFPAGAGPEIGLAKLFGATKRYLLTGRLGAIVMGSRRPNGPGFDFFVIPEAKIGMSVRLGK
jgi:hypothetical protein